MSAHDEGVPPARNTPQDLLDAVDLVIGEHGPSGVTLRRVGDAAGLSHTAAAHHYKDKPGLFTAYITRAWEQVADALDLALDVDDHRQGLLAAGTSYAHFALANPAAFSVMSRLELARVDTPELWAARERGFFALTAAVQGAQEAGWASERDTFDLVATTWSFVHGFVDLWTGGPLWAPFDGHDLVSVLERLLSATLDALDAPPTFS